MAEDLGSLVRAEWASLIAENDLRVASEGEWSVTLHNEKLGIAIVRDRGEVTVSAFLLADGEPAYGWHYDGMVGKASESRLLQIAAERLAADPRLLAGDEALYQQISLERRRLAREWTDYYARKGPRPKSGQMP